MPKKSQTSKATKQNRRTWMKKAAAYAAAFLLGGGAVAGLIWKRVDELFQPRPKVVVELVRKFSEPKGNSYKIQVLTISNVGERQAEELSVRIEYPRMAGLLNYSIESREPVNDLVRTDDYLSFKLPRLAYSETVVVALNASVASIRSTDVSVIFKEGKVEQRQITEK